MRILYAALCGFILDLLLGDPAWLTPIHPVVLMGKAITALEKLLRALFPKTDRGEETAGALLALLMTAGTYTLCKLTLLLLDRLCPPAAFALEIIWCWQALAVRDLKVEALRVQTALETEGLDATRSAVARIVGRDTAALDEHGVARAAVETVAENFSDGVVAPLLYMLLRRLRSAIRRSTPWTAWWATKTRAGSTSGVCPQSWTMRQITFPPVLRRCF